MDKECYVMETLGDEAKMMVSDGGERGLGVTKVESERHRLRQLDEGQGKATWTMVLDDTHEILSPGQYRVQNVAGDGNCLTASIIIASQMIKGQEYTIPSALTIRGYKRSALPQMVSWVMGLLFDSMTVHDMLTAYGTVEATEGWGDRLALLDGVKVGSSLRSTSLFGEWISSFRVDGVDTPSLTQVVAILSKAILPDGQWMAVDICGMYAWAYGLTVEVWIGIDERPGCYRKLVSFGTGVEVIRLRFHKYGLKTKIEKGVLEWTPKQVSGLEEFNHFDFFVRLPTQEDSKGGGQKLRLETTRGESRGEFLAINDKIEIDRERIRDRMDGE